VVFSALKCLFPVLMLVPALHMWKVKTFKDRKVKSDLCQPFRCCFALLSNHELSVGHLVPHASSAQQRSRCIESLRGNLQFDGHRILSASSFQVV
jgi:hypothetical protein